MAYGHDIHRTRQIAAPRVESDGASVFRAALSTGEYVAQRGFEHIAAGAVANFVRVVAYGRAMLEELNALLGSLHRSRWAVNIPPVAIRCHE